MASPVEVTINTDGGARGNPGPAGIGVVIQARSGRTLDEISEAIGFATNNVAEYTAVIRALERAGELGARRVSVRADSLLVVEQLKGTYRVKEPTLKRLHARASSLARSFEHVAYEHVPRERNKRADRLVNKAVDAWLAEHGDDSPPSQGDPPQASLF